MAPERMVTVAIDLPLRIWLRLRQETRQRAYAKGELEPETISPIVREIVEEAIDRLDREHSNAAEAAPASTSEAQSGSGAGARKRAAGAGDGASAATPGSLFGDE